MRHVTEVWRNKRGLVTGIVVLALFILAPAALSRPGVVLQVVTPEVTVVASDNTAAESGANTGTFTISRSGPTTDPLTVNLSITGTATNGSDYSALSTSVVIPATQASVAVPVTPTNDAIHEDSEDVIVTVTANALYTVGSPSAATVTISDDDLPSVSVMATDASASEAGGDVGTFTISRVGATTGALTVAYTLTGTASNGTDYSSLSTSVVIPVGQSSAAVTVTPTNDGVSEPAETVILTITANALYTVGSPSAATVTISDNDLPSVKVVATDGSAAEAGAATGTFTVTRTGVLTAPMTVNYIISGSATNGADYGALSGSVVIAAGAASATVVVTPIDDVIDENNESVILTLAAGAGYRIGSPNHDDVTIADNDGTPNPGNGDDDDEDDEGDDDGDEGDHDDDGDHNDGDDRDGDDRDGDDRDGDDRDGGDGDGDGEGED
jgi:Calx-beta domain-containing protein